MDIQTEVQKIHHQFGVTEKANYEIQKLFDKLILEDRAKQLRLGAVSQQREQLAAFYEHLNNIDKPLRHGNGYKEADDFIAANCG